VALKRRAQERIYRDTKGMTPEQEIAYFDRAVRSGPLAGFWQRVEEAQERRS
jgi:hypothetical protein